MQNTPALALSMILLGGITQAMFMLPSKWAKGWKFEHIWLVFSFFCFLLFPWAIVRACVPEIAAVLTGTGGHTLLLMGIYGTGWALASLSFGIGISMMGLSLGFALIFGLSAFLGSLAPLLLSTASVPHGKMLAIIPSLVLMLAGVFLCSLAGKWQEKQDAASPVRGRYMKGILVCAFSGLMGAVGNLGFVAGGGMIVVARAQGVSVFAANMLVVAYLCLFLFILNASYSLALLWQHSSFGVFLLNGSARYFGFAMLMAVFWIASFVLYGIGARVLGRLGLSLGWGVFMCTVVASANALGVLTGEWRLAPAAAKRQLGIGLGVLMIAIVGLTYANSIG